MTWKPEQITVSGAEVAEFKRLIEEGHGTGFALAAFLAARMPDELEATESIIGDGYERGYNAARYYVARGRT
jgi:hypothetical protein